MVDCGKFFSRFVKKSIVGFTIVLMGGAFATTDIQPNGNLSGGNTAANCTQPVLGTYEGSTNFEAKWSANSVPLRWYNQGAQLTVQDAANTCTYDGALNIPAVPPSRTGYTFGGWKVLGLPTGYTRLEYLESNGSQYIDTGVTLTSDDVVYEWNGKDSSSSATSLFGVEYTSGTNRVFGGILYGSNSSRGGWLGSTKSVPMGYNSSDGAFHSWSWVINSNHTTYLVKDGTALSAVSWSGSLNKLNTICLYCNHINSSFNEKSQVAYKYFKITDNGNLVFDGIPAKRNSDGVFGIYDTVSDIFFTNAGSGTFTAGPELN